MDKQIVDRFYRLTESMKKIVFSNCNIGVMSRSEFSMLQLINLYNNEFGIITTAELSEKLHISKPAVSQMINVLEEKNYVIREINKNDRRLMSVSLTDLGILSLKQEKENYLNRINSALDIMGREDSEVFIGLMEKYFSIIRDMRKD